VAAKRRTRADKAKPKRGPVTQRREPKTDKRAQLAHQRSLSALDGMRSRGLSLAAAAREAGTTPRTMQRYVGTALRRAKDGRYMPSRFDRIPRTIRFFTSAGRVQLTVRDSRTVSHIARYMAAVKQFLLTGDRRGLWPFRGKAIRVGKVAYPFLTDSKTLERLAHVGEVSFEDFYALTTGETK
jgi:hypothetical protein